jgi:hypothetical protein
MGERSVQPKGVGNRGCTGGKEEREGTAQDEGGTVGVLIAPKAARRQDRRLGPIRPGESKPETEFPATTLRVKMRKPSPHPSFTENGGATYLSAKSVSRTLSKLVGEQWQR